MPVVLPHYLSFRSHTQIATDRAPERESIAGVLAAQGKDVLAACTKGDLGLLRALLADGSDTSAADELGNTALHIVAADGDLRLLELLLPACELSSTNKAGLTALHLAVHWGHRDAALRLIESGAAADVADSDGELPLHLAVRNQDAECVRLLVAAQGCTTLPNQKGVSALEMATGGKLLDITAILEGPVPAMPLSKRKRDERAVLMVPATGCACSPAGHRS